MADDRKGGIVILIGMMFVLGTGAVALRLLLSSSGSSSPPPPRATVFDDTRSSAELQGRMEGREMAAAERRKSSLDQAPRLKAKAGTDARRDRMDRLLAKMQARIDKARKSLPGGRNWSIVKKAEQVYFKNKNGGRYKKATGIKKWKNDFLSYPDLKKINDDYYNKDGSAINFIRRTLGSPNFGRVVKKNINKPDVHSFLMSMMGSPSVTKASKTMTKEYGLGPALDRLRIPGIGSMGQLKKGGKEFQKGKAMTVENTFEMLGMDKDLLDPNKLIQKGTKKQP